MKKEIKEKIINIIIYVTIMAGISIIGWWAMMIISSQQQAIYDIGFKRGLNECSTK